MEITPTKPEPTDIFKYASFDRAERILTDRTLKFSDPETFNDPFDCVMDNVYFDFSGALDPKVQLEVDQLREMFKGSELTNDLLARAYQEVQLGKKNGIAVTCFSLDPKNLLMWAHYADKHTGMCLHFDNNLPKDSKYTDVRIDIQGHIEYHLIDKVNYCSNKIQGVKYIYLNKSHHWEYENEYRLLTMMGNGIYNFKPGYLKAVIFGIKTLPAEQKRIMEICESNGLNHVRFLVAKKEGPELVYNYIDI